jgi:hypothetical protein
VDVDALATLTEGCVARDLAAVVERLAHAAVARTLALARDRDRRAEPPLASLERVRATATATAWRSVPIDSGAVRARALDSAEVQALPADGEAALKGFVPAALQGIALVSKFMAT